MERDAADRDPDFQNLARMSRLPMLPKKHEAYLWKLRESGFMPEVVFDIGACVLHWSTVVRRVWPEATIVLFDAFAKAEPLYIPAGFPLYHIGVLSDRDGAEVTFYQNDREPGGNSYYREVGHPAAKLVFPDSSGRPMVTKTLDTVVRERGFPRPDLIKIDVQGAEGDVIRGGLGCVAHCQRMIVEMQRTVYNAGAPLVTETLPFIESLGFRCDAPLFCDNGPDGDYSFVKTSPASPAQPPGPATLEVASCAISMPCDGPNESMPEPTPGPACRAPCSRSGRASPCTRPGDRSLLRTGTPPYHNARSRTHPSPRAP